MEFKTRLELQNTSKEKPTEEPVGDAISRVENTIEMFNLPNRQPLTPEMAQKRAKQLNQQYDIAVRHDAIRVEIKSKIAKLLDKSSNHYKEAREILDKAPQEAVPELARNLRYFPEGVQVEIARLVLDKAPQEVAQSLVRNLKYLPEGIREEIDRLVLDKAPQEVAQSLVRNLKYLPEGIREEIARLVLDKAPQEAVPELVGNLPYLPEGVQEEIARLAFDKASQEAAPELAVNLIGYLPEGVREEIARLLLDKAPQKAAQGLAWNLRCLPEGVREEIARLLLDKAPQEAAQGLVRNLQFLPEGVREEIIRLALNKAPQEAVWNLAGNLRYLPEGVREEIIRLALNKAPQEAVWSLDWNLRCYPEWVREKIIRFSLRYLSEGFQVEIARLLLDKAPQEAAPELAWYLEYLPEGVREEIENEVKQIAQIVERAKLSQAEKRNPVLYKDIDELDEQFLRKEFPKTGTKTLLLGKTLINNVILRIIPNHTFISWMNAYRATDTWKKAGFDYIPVETIIRAHASNDGKYTRVYSGVLGVSVNEYLKMYSNKNHHSYVREQVEKIIYVLKEMGIEHGHTHDNNFCILHERTPEGEIDWDRPPRVYCIDFDQSVSCLQKN